ncbi:MAG: thymidylate kinase, partial [Thaumarchaeota archaeon]|nr:thymidylate kinase [Nitrososphaerota archaeon]
AKKKRWKIVNASQSKNDVHNDVMKVVAKKMGL